MPQLALRPGPRPKARNLPTRLRRARRRSQGEQDSTCRARSLWEEVSRDLGSSPIPRKTPPTRRHEDLSRPRFRCRRPLLHDVPRRPPRMDAVPLAAQAGALRPLERIEPSCRQGREQGHRRRLPRPPGCHPRAPLRDRQSSTEGTQEHQEMGIPDRGGRARPGTEGRRPTPRAPAWRRSRSRRRPGGAFVPLLCVGSGSKACCSVRSRTTSLLRSPR